MLFKIDNILMTICAGIYAAFWTVLEIPDLISDAYHWKRLEKLERNEINNFKTENE